MLDSAHRVLAYYPVGLQGTPLTSCGSAGGFSGSRFWRWSCSQGDFGLRRWPKEHPDLTNLEFIHRILEFCGRHFDIIPVPARTTDGVTYVQLDGHLWEVTPWLPGFANFRQQPQPDKLIAAMRALGSFHLVAADSRLGLQVQQTSPGIKQRLRQVRELLSGGLDSIQRGIDAPHRQLASSSLAIADLAQTIVRDFRSVANTVFGALDSLESKSFVLQPVIRDIWHEHILFTGNRVSGMVDFGALKIDTVATDIARLLGSLVGDDADLWKIGMDAYQSVRMVDEIEQQCIRAFDWSGSALSGINWLQWIYVDRKHFDDWRRVSERLLEAATRLRFLAENLGASRRLYIP